MCYRLEHHAGTREPTHETTRRSNRSLSSAYRSFFDARRGSPRTHRVLRRRPSERGGGGRPGKHPRAQPGAPHPHARRRADRRRCLASGRDRAGHPPAHDGPGHALLAGARAGRCPARARVQLRRGRALERGRVRAGSHRRARERGLLRHPALRARRGRSARLRGGRRLDRGAALVERTGRCLRGVVRGQHRGDARGQPAPGGQGGRAALQRLRQLRPPGLSGRRAHRRIPGELVEPHAHAGPERHLRALGRGRPRVR